jgi:uncharacterized phiE125 gp8 family phage protein
MSAIDFFGDLYNAGFHREAEGHVGLSTTIPPTVEPVSVDQVIAQINSLDESNTAQVNLLPVYISSARERAESYCNRTFPIQTRMMSLDRFPCSGARGVIRLRRPPIISVASVTYLDDTQTRQTVDPSTYACDMDLTDPRLYLKPGNCWPNICRQPGSVQIVYQCGYASVPSSIVHAILLMAADGYQFRQTQLNLDHGIIQNQTAMNLLWQFKTF